MANINSNSKVKGINKFDQEKKIRDLGSEISKKAANRDKNKEVIEFKTKSLGGKNLFIKNKPIFVSDEEEEEVKPVTQELEIEMSPLTNPTMTANLQHLMTEEKSPVVMPKKDEPNLIATNYSPKNPLWTEENKEVTLTKCRSSQESLKKFSFFEGIDISKMNDNSNYDFAQTLPKPSSSKSGMKNNLYLLIDEPNSMLNKNSEITYTNSLMKPNSSMENKKLNIDDLKEGAANLKTIFDNNKEVEIKMTKSS